MGFRSLPPGEQLVDKRQLQLIRGRTQLFWEIERTRTRVRSRSWGPRRKQYIVERGFRSEARAQSFFEAKLAEQTARGFREPDSDVPYPWQSPNPTEGELAVAALASAVKKHLVPGLRARGFKGSFPKFHRVGRSGHSVVWFMFGRAGGHVSVGLAVLAPRPDATPSADYNRAINVRNRSRTELGALAGDDAALMFFDTANTTWATEWPQRLADLLAELLANQGEAWLSRQRR